MTRPLQFGLTKPLQPGPYGGGPDQPEGTPPTPDCCSVDAADLPDRASNDNGANAWSLEQEYGTPVDQNAAHGTDTDGGSIGPTFNDATFPPSNANDGNNGTFARANTGVVSAGSTLLKADLGSAYAVFSIVSRDTSASGVAATGFTVDYSTNGTSWTPLGLSPVVTGANPWTSTWTPASPITARYWRLNYAHGGGFVHGTDVYTFAINGATPVDAVWSLAAPNINDGDDTTYETTTAIAEVHRLDLGDAYRIVSTRLRIAEELSGSRTYTIDAWNELDESDRVTLATISFTATGSYTAQDVEASWYTEESYQYFELDGAVGSRRVYAWELREPTLATNHQHDATGVAYDNGASGLTADDVQAAIDELAAAAGAGSTPSGVLAVDYTFDTTTTDSDPGAGKLRLSNATQTSAVTIRADLADVNGATVTNVLDAVAAGLSTVKAYAAIRKTDDRTKWLLGTVSAIASPSGYRNITWANIAASGSSPFANGDAVTLIIALGTLAHGATHQSGGADAIKLDDLAAPDDNTDLNASTSAHGLLRKLDNTSTHYLDGTGAWSTPAGGGGSLTVEEADGSPTDSAVTKIVFPNGSIAIASHVVTFTEDLTRILTTQGDFAYLPITDVLVGTKSTSGSLGGGYTEDSTSFAVTAGKTYRFDLTGWGGGTLNMGARFDAGNIVDAWYTGPSHSFVAPGGTTTVKLVGRNNGGANLSWTSFTVTEVNASVPTRIASGAMGRTLLATADAAAARTAIGAGVPLTVEEVDGSPTDSAVTKVVFPNGTLGIASHVATYTPAVGAGATAVGAKAFNSTTQTIASGSAVPLTLDSETTGSGFDTDGFHSTSTNTSRMTIPAGLGGKYLCIGATYFNTASATGQRIVGVFKNGATVGGHTSQRGDGSFGPRMSSAVVLDMVPGDYVEVFAYQDTGSTMPVGNATFDLSSQLTIIRLDAGATPPGYEFDYAAFTSPVTVSATTEATANTIVTGAAVTYDGSTTVMLEFFAAYYTAPSLTDTIFVLYDNGSTIGYIGLVSQPTISSGTSRPHPPRLSRRLTPSAGSHTYSVRAAVISGVTTGASVGAGAGGSGNHSPGFMRITKV